MRNILRKEMKLSASILSYLFILFGLMFFLPGYPILCGAFFVTLGIFQGFQFAREANDIVFSALLPEECETLKLAAREAVICNRATDDIASFAHGLSFFLPYATVSGDSREILGHYGAESGSYAALAVSRQATSVRSPVMTTVSISAVLRITSRSVLKKAL